jgi:gamma-glutamylcysteine synthetase
MSMELPSVDGDHLLKKERPRFLRQCDRTAKLLNYEHKPTRYSQSIAAQCAKIQEQALTPSARRLNHVLIINKGCQALLSVPHNPVRKAK